MATFGAFFQTPLELDWTKLEGGKGVEWTVLTFITDALRMRVGQGHDMVQGDFGPNASSCAAEGDTFVCGRSSLQL